MFTVCVYVCEVLCVYVFVLCVYVWGFGECLCVYVYSVVCIVYICLVFV